MADWFDENRPDSLSPAEQTYANQTAAREAYYNRYPVQRPVFSADQQAGLDEILARDQALNQVGPVDTKPGPGSDSPFFPGGTFSGDYQGYFNHLFPGDTLTGEMLKSKEADLKRAGINVVTSASGNTAWINYPGSGGDIDVIQDYGGLNRKAWQLPGSGQRMGPAQTDVAQIPGLQPGSLLQPFPEQFSARPSGMPAVQPRFEPPPDFVAPTMDEALADPSTQVALRRGQEALERSAAAKGTLLTTGTLRNLDDQAQDTAKLGYSQVYGRRAGEYESKYGKKVENFERDYNQALGEFGIRKGQFYEGQDRPFNKLTTLAGFGTLPPVNYAGQYGNLQLQGANQAGNYLTQGANAAAAGQIGSSNAWQNAFGSLANLGGQYANVYSNPWRQPYAGRPQPFFNLNPRI